MSSNIYSPWAKLEYYKATKNKLRYCSIIAGSVSLLLMCDLYLIKPHERVTLVFPSSCLLPVTLACIAGTVFLAYNYMLAAYEFRQMVKGEYITDHRRFFTHRTREVIGELQQPSQSPEPFIYTSPRQPEHTIQPFKPVLKVPKFEDIDESTNLFLQKHGIDLKMRGWVQNIRLWFSKTIIPLIIASHMENAMELNQLLKHFSGTSDRKMIYSGSFDGSMCNFTYEELTEYKHVGLNGLKDIAQALGTNYLQDRDTLRQVSLLPMPSQHHVEARNRIRFVESYKQRLLLEKYFKIPGYKARSYVIDRLNTLMKTSCLSGYSSKSGGRFLGDGWTAKKPTDAHILSHIFFRVLNNGNNPNDDPEFDMMKEILCNQYRGKPQMTSHDKIMFFQKNFEDQIDTHFDVLCGNEAWPAYKGNDNLFCAIALFLYLVKHRKHGFYYAMNCAELLELIR